MDPTTLVTFLFKTPPHIRAVELFGSWDNFTFPYRMHHDRRRGAGCWSGCFKFENIIFDGEKVEWNRPRSGGLKQGGTYWYYYRLNYDLEAYDDLRPYTADCPLMPGQTVNVIEVPRELVRTPSRCRSAYGDLIGTLASIQEVQTLDPDRKFASVEPPPVSRFHKNSKSEDALRKKAVYQQKAQHQPQPPLPLPRQQQTQQGKIRMVESRSPPSPPRSRQRRPSISSDERSLVSADSYRSTSPESSPQSAHRRRRGPWATEPMLNTSPESLPDSPARSLLDTDEPLPTFPYPNVLGASPLSSTDELSGSLFPARSSVISVVEDDGNSPPRDSSKQIRHASSCSPIITTSEPVSMQSPAPTESTQPDSSPASVQNVQFYGSRPSSTSESPTHFRPRMYSLPNNELRDSYPSTRSASAVMTPDGIPQFHDHHHDEENKQRNAKHDDNDDNKTVSNNANKPQSVEAPSPPERHYHRQSPPLPSAAATAAAYATLKPPPKQSIASPPPATTTTTRTTTTVRNLTITRTTPAVSSPPGALNYTLPTEPDTYPRHRDSPIKSSRYHRGGPHGASGHAPAAVPTPIVVVSCADDAPSAPFSLVDEETLFFSEIGYLGGSIL